MIEEEEIFTSKEFCGHASCPGCGEKIILRHILEALGRKTVIVCPAGCAAVTDGIFPHTISPVPFLHTPFDAVASCAAGVRAGLDMSGRSDVTVMVWAGDGATFDIGMGALSAIAERNEDILYICYDNEAYMNTGIQRSSATPFGSWTTTTPKGRLKSEPKKDIDFILAAHKIPYIATASPAFIDDLKAKVGKAKTAKGLRFLHVLSPCPPGWKSDPAQSITLAKLAVECNIFPLYEIENGEIVRLSYKSKSLPVGEYLEMQGRFRYLSEEEIEAIQSSTDKYYSKLKSLHESEKPLKGVMEE
jgi:pyruvate ferredoxin oxidoreductase beta subunit